jgi:hypothetical protein
MPIFNVRAPDGSLMKISGPEDATDEELIQIAEQSYQPKEKKSKDISFGERLTDVGAGVISGAGALAQLPGQLSGLAGFTEIDDTGLQGIGKNIQKYGQEMKSAGLKSREQERSEKIKEAEKTGQLSAAATAFSETIKDPALLMSFLAEQAPQLIVPFGAAKGAAALTGAKAVGKGLAAEEAAIAAGRAGTKAAIGTGAVQQGADIGSGAYENIYAELINKGANPDDAKQSALNLARASGASGAIISLLAQRLPGASSLEKSLAGVPGTGGRIAGAVTSGLGESLGEVAEETGGRFSQNLAMREVRPEQSLTEGLGETAGMAAVGGVGMGGISGALQRQAQAQGIEAPKTLQQHKEMLALGMNQPFTPVSLPDGSVAMTQEDLDNYERMQFEGKYAPQPADKLALGLSEPFNPVSLPDGSVALTRADLAAYEEEQFRNKYAPQPNLNTVQPAATPPQLGYSPLPGVPKIAPDGTVLLTPEQEFENRYAPQKKRMTVEEWNSMSPEQRDATMVQAQLQDQERIKAAEEEEQGRRRKQMGFKKTWSPEESESMGLTKEPPAGKPEAAAVEPKKEVAPSGPAAAMTKAQYRQDQSTLGKSDHGAMSIDLNSVTDPKKLVSKYGERNVRMLGKLHGINVKDIKNVAQKLLNINDNIKAVKGKTAEDFKGINVDGLKDLLKQMGLSGYGNRPQLIQRLISYEGSVTGAFNDRLQDAKHKLAVTQAVQKGEPVSDEVLKDYPDLTLYARPRGSEMYKNAVTKMMFQMTKGDVGMEIPGIAKSLRDSLDSIQDPREREVTSDVADAMDAYYQKTFGNKKEASAPAAKDKQFTGLDKVSYWRKQAWEKNPLMAFMADKGLYHEKGKPGSLMNEFNAGKQIMISGYGPVFKSSGLKIDDMLPIAIEVGFLPEGATEADLEALISKAVSGQKVEALYKEQGVDETAARYEEGMAKAYSEYEGQETPQGTPKEIAQDYLSRVEEIGVDPSDIQEQAFEDTKNMSEDAYYERIAELSRQALDGGEMQTLSAVGSGEKGFTATKEELQMQKDLLGKDMLQAAQYVINKAPNAFYKFVGNKILQKLKKMQAAGVVLNFGVESSDRRNGKLYASNGITTFFQSKDGRPSSFRILLNGAPVMEKQNGYPSGMNYKTLMHELLHVTTQAEIQFLNYEDANNPAVGELKRLYNKVAEEFLAQEKAGTLPQFLVDFRKGHNNALESVDEMLTWSMTDERMQKWMSDIKVGDKTLFSKIIDLIRSVMGIAKPYETALDRLVRTADQIIDIETQETADGMTKRGYYYGPKEGVKRQPKEQQSLFSRAAQAMMEEDTKELRLGKEEKTTTPTGAGADSMRILEAMGRGNQEAEAGYAQKIRQAWDNARDNPKATAEAAKKATSSFLDRVETWTFSSDAGLNNRIRREIEDSTMSSQEKIGMLLNTSLSQTVHSDAVASLFLQRGGIKYNEELHKWEGVDNASNFVKLSTQLDELAAKNGLTKQQAELVAHTAFEAKRLRSLVRFNQELDDKVEAVRKEAAAKRNSSPVAASALSKEASRLQEKRKFISPAQEAMIAPGMELFKIHPELNDVVKTWNEIRTSTVKTLIDTGLWSENEAEEMLSNADYVPFYREEQLENNQGPKGFISGLQVKAKEHRLKGSSRPVNDIFDNQVRWVQYSINRAVRNRSALALADTAVEVGAAKQVKDRQSGENVVRVWRNGEEQFYSMDDPMFMEAFTGLEAIVIPSWKWASDLANVLRQSVVMYPLFSVAQVPQDSFAAIFSSGLKPQYALRIPVLAVKEFVQTLRGASKTHAELKNVGAVGVRDFTSAMVRLDAEIYAGLKAPPGVLGKIKYGLNHIAMAADNAVRQAVYEASIAQGVSRAEAMEKAFEVFNVRRKGSSKSLALAGQLIPFFNAYLAAQNVAYKTITGRGISPTERQDAFKTLAATTASVMVLSLMYAMLNGDDEDYLKKPATVRDRLLMIPGTGGMSVPLRADLFTMPKLITEHMYLMMTDKGYEDGRKFRDSMKAALGSAVLGPTAVPQAIKPLVEVGINYDFFQGRPLIGTYQQKLDTERQFTDSTSELGKILGKTGLVSPIAADHLVRGMLGSAGGLIIYATNPMLHSDPTTPRPSLSEKDAIATLPGMSGFMMKSYESALKKDFYTLKEEVDKAANTMNDLKKRSPQEIQGFLADEKNLARVGLQKSVNAIGERLSQIRAAITQTTNSQMPADEKQRQIEILRNAEEQMLKGVDVKKLRELGKI